MRDSSEGKGFSRSSMDEKTKMQAMRREGAEGVKMERQRTMDKKKIRNKIWSLEVAINLIKYFNNN